MIAVPSRCRADRASIRSDVGLGQGKGCDQVSGRELRQVSFLLLGGAVHDDALRADPVVCSDEGAERRRRKSQFESDCRLLGHRKAEAAVFLRNAHSEQTEFPNLLNGGVRNPIVFGDLRFEGDQPLAHETRNGVAKLGQGFCVQAHYLGLRNIDGAGGGLGRPP